MTRTNRIAQTTIALTLAASALFAGGCNNDIKAERDALWSENNELKSQLDATRQALEACENDRSGYISRINELETATPAAPSNAGANTGASTGFEGIDDVDIDKSSGAVTVNIASDVLFSSGKADLKTSAKTTLAQVAGVIKSNYPGKLVRVEGYTDTDPIKKSKWKDNLELSAHRAMSVQRYLNQRGVPGAQMYSAAKHTLNQKGSKAASRRVEIVVITD